VQSCAPSRAPGMAPGEQPVPHRAPLPPGDLQPLAPAWLAAAARLPSWSCLFQGQSFPPGCRVSSCLLRFSGSLQLQLPAPGSRAGDFLPRKVASAALQSLVTHVSRQPARPLRAESVSWVFSAPSPTAQHPLLASHGGFLC